MKHFNETHVHSDSRYKVTLPRMSNAPLLGNSRVHAIQRFYSNERSISRRGQWEAFQSVIQEYLDMGHAEPVPTTSPPLPAGSTYYLPMHSVVKETSSTTKLRVVFDASAKTTSGASLNDCLMVGPTLFPNITDILLRFRIYSIALSSDVVRWLNVIIWNYCYRVDKSTKKFLCVAEVITRNFGRGALVIFSRLA